MTLEEFSALLATENHEYRTPPEHNYAIDLSKLENAAVRDVFDKLLSLSNTNNSNMMRQLLLNTLVARGVIQPMRAIAIDGILEDLEKNPPTA